MDLDQPCPHEDFEVFANVDRLTEVEGGPITHFHAQITIKCFYCDEKFRFTGVPVGLSPFAPMVSADQTQLRAPIRPAGQDPDMGIAIPEFKLRIDPQEGEL